MKRIVSKAEKERIERERLSRMVICNTPKKSNHCLKDCIHGRLHEPDTGTDSCLKPQFCSLSLAGIRKVRCKKLTKKEIEEIINES